MKVRLLLLLLLCVGFTAASRADSAPKKPAPDKVRATRSITGRFVGFEVGDYMHAVVRTADGKTSSFFVVPGMDYFLARHKNKTLRMTYQVVDSHVPEAGGVIRIERASDAKVGGETFIQWWKQERKRSSLTQIDKKYGKLVEQATLKP